MYAAGTLITDDTPGTASMYIHQPAREGRSERPTLKAQSMLATAAQHKPLNISTLHAMAREGRSWEFLCAAVGLPEPDETTRLLISASFARLGLATLALEAHSDLSPEMRSSVAGVNLRSSIAKLPSDLVPFARREDAVLRNMRALHPRLRELEQHLPAWRARADASEVFVAFDSNLVTRPRRTEGAPAWDGLRLGDHKGRATALVAQASGLRSPMPPAIVLDGICPPWMLLAAFDHAGVRPIGYRPRFTIVEPDWMEFLDGLSMADSTAVWNDERVELFVGQDALDRYRDSLHARLDAQLEPLLINSGVSGESRLASIVHDAIAAQRNELVQHARTTEAMYAQASFPEIRRRLEAAQRHGGSLRALIPTSRYSTFVQHSASDLAAALRRAGHVAEVLIESRDDEQMSALAYRRVIERLNPDLVVLVNYPRATMGDAFPANVPFVCWIQDAMPHLFEAKIGRAQGPLDFVMGYTFGNLFDAFGYPVDQAMPAAVVADIGKFHDGPVDPSLLARHECEIAMVTHHSETPDEMHARLSRDMTNDPGIRAAMERVRVALPAIVENALTHAASSRVAAIVERAAHDAMGPTAPAKSIEQLQRHYAMPMVERIFRHQTLAWAAELCQERGWRLHLYGKGWNAHPTLAPFAKGELGHNEDLRAAYRAARVHLHAGLSALVHQRVMECALSGGLCLGRTSYEALAPHHARASAALVQGTPDVVDDQGRCGYLPRHHPALLARVELHERLGIPTSREVVFMSRERADAFRRKAALPSELVDPAAVFGDLAATTFWSRESFRERMTRAVQDSVWRDRVRSEIRARVVEKFTYDALVPRLINLVATGANRAMGDSLEKAA